MKIILPFFVKEKTKTDEKIFNEKKTYEEILNTNLFLRGKNYKLFNLKNNKIFLNEKEINPKEVFLCKDESNEIETILEKTDLEIINLLKSTMHKNTLFEKKKK